MRGREPRNFVELHGLELLVLFIWSGRIWAWGWQRQQLFIHWDGLMRRWFAGRKGGCLVLHVGVVCMCFVRFVLYIETESPF